MLLQIVDALHEHADLSGWQVRETRKASRQRFLNKQDSEGLRQVESLAWEVEVLVNQYPKRKGQGAPSTGSGRFTLDAGSLARLGAEIDQAVAAAGLAKNDPYQMHSPGPQQREVKLADPAMDPATAAQALKGLEDRLRAAVALEGTGIRLAAAEFFADRAGLRLINSQGLQSASDASLFSGEFVLLADGADGAESEVFRAFKRRRMQDWDLEAEVAAAARAGRLRTKAMLPPTGSFDVAFSGEALDHLFEWLASQSSGANKYNRIIDNAPGAVLVKAEPGASLLNVWHNAIQPWGVGSYRFDSAGVAATRRLLVEHGALVQYWANSRYAQYLKMEPSGELGNLEVEPGTFSQDELLKPAAGRPLLHLYEFSYLEPNPVTGEFSAEIRLGELIDAQGSRPVKGGSVSGSSAQAFSRVRLSKETVQRERYLGPAVVRCPNLTIAGA